MEFVQIMEFRSGLSEAIEFTERYSQEAKGQTFARNVSVCEDRSRPGVIIVMAHFDSYEDAQKNNELEITQRFGKELAERVGETKFIDLNVVKQFAT